MRSLASDHPAEILGPLGGELGIATEDVAVAGSKLRVMRQLVSDSSANGAVGKGWRLNWESRLSRSDDGQHAVLLDGGGVAVFVKEGEQLTAKGVGTLAFTADGAVLTRDDGGIDTFDRDGRLIERRIGSDAAKLRYGTLGQLEEVTASDGGSVKFRHDDSGRLLEAKASDGSSARYGYADAPLPAGSSASWSYSYDEAGRLSALNGTAAGETHFKYDAKGRVTSRSWADGGEERFDYDDAQRSVRHTAADGQVLTSQRSEDGRKLTMTDATGAKAVQEFNAAGQMVSVTGDKGRATFEYDTLGRLTTTTGADGAKQSFEYLGATKLPVTITGPDGKRKLGYDAQRNLTSIDDGKGRAEFGYDKDGRLVSTKLPGGESWNYAYDEKGRRTSATDAQGKVTEFRYDEAGRLAGEKLPDGTSSGYEYSADGRLAAITGADGARCTFAYDAAGQIVSHDDSGTGNVQALLSRLDQLEASRGTGTAPVPSVPRPVVAVAAKTVRGLISPGFEATVARPAINPTVATPVPPPSNADQVASGARIGRLTAGGLIVAANVYSAVQEGKTPDQIAEELVWSGVTAAGFAVLGAAAGAVLSPVAIGVATAAGTAYGTYRAAVRLGESIGVGAYRQRAQYEGTERGLIAMFGVFGRLAELRTLRADIIALRTTVKQAAAEGMAAMDAVQGFAAQLPPSQSPLTQARVTALAAAAQDGATKKSAAGAGATRAETGAASVSTKLDVADQIANSANPTAPDVERAQSLFAEAQVIVTGVVKEATEVNATATALRGAASDSKSVTAERDAALAKIPALERLIETASKRNHAVYQGLLPIDHKQNVLRELASELRAKATELQNHLGDLAPEMRALLGRRMAELDQFVNWKPEPEIETAIAFRNSGLDPLTVLFRKIEAARTFLNQIPSDLTMPTADDEARRATVASAAAQARMTASAALIQKLRSMGAEVVVPAVVNLSAAEAQSLLAAAGFKITWTASSKVPGANDKPGTVEHQSPTANSKAKSGTAVTLTVLGPKPDASNNMPATAGMLKVPHGLRGMTEADAVAALNAAGFAKVAVVSANSPTPDGKGGTVDDYVPAGGLERDPKTTVTLYVFPKPGEAIVPDVHGLTVREAKLQIEGAKLTTALEVSRRLPDKKEQEFTVQAQSHAKGEKLAVGQPVTLSIYPKFGTTPSNGVPDVVGKKLDDAYALIRSAGLKPGGVTVVPLPKDKQDNADTVANQTPLAGQPIPENKVVTIVVYAPLPRNGSDDKNPDLGMADAARRDSSKLVGTYRGTFQLTEAAGAVYDNNNKEVNQNMAAQEVTIKVEQIGKNWFVSVIPSGGKGAFTLQSPSLVVNGQSLRQEVKPTGGGHWHTIWEMTYENGELTGTRFMEDTHVQRLSGKRWFNRAVFKASKVP